MHILRPSGPRVPSWRQRRVVTAFAMGTVAAVVVTAPLLIVGYGHDRLPEALYVTGLVVILLVVPFGVVLLGRALALRSSARVTRFELVLWLLAALALWWCLPALLEPDGGPALYGLALAIIPLSTQLLVTAHWLARSSEPISDDQAP